MITISVKNTPEEAKYWLPIFYPESVSVMAKVQEGNEEIYPPEYLPIWSGWGTKLIGPSYADLTILLFDEGYNKVSQMSTGQLEWLDGVAYVYDWETRQVEQVGKAKGFPWLAVGAVGAVAAAMLIMKPARRK